MRFDNNAVRVLLIGMETIGDRIKQARKARGLSQQELAEACGWEHQSRISGYERMGRKGGREPSSEEIAIVAKVLRIRPAWLATKDGSMDGAEIIASGARGQQSSAELTVEWLPTHTRGDEAREIAQLLTEGEWAYIKEQAHQLIARRMPGSNDTPSIATSKPGLINIPNRDAEAIIGRDQEEGRRIANVDSYEQLLEADRDKPPPKPGRRREDKPSARATPKIAKQPKKAGADRNADDVD